MLPEWALQSEKKNIIRSLSKLGRLRICIKVMCTFIIQVDMTNIIGPKGWFQRWSWSFEQFQNGGCF